MRRIAALLLTAGLVGGAVPATASAATPKETRYAARVLALVNAARAEARTCGGTRYRATRPLVAGARITRVADRFAGRMAKEDFFDHTAPDGSTMSDRMHAAGFDGAIGENIAAGYATPKAVVQGWLTSPGHCANIMNPAYRRVGVGYATSSTADYGTYWVQDFSD